jgi:hypothetical protein
MSGIAPLFWLVPIVLAWCAARTLDSIRIDVYRNAADETPAQDTMRSNRL